jgi:hypothetical protein
MGGSDKSPAATPAAYTWNPAPPGQPEFTSTPTAVLASSGATAAAPAKTGTGSYTGTVLGG